LSIIKEMQKENPKKSLGVLTLKNSEKYYFPKNRKIMRSKNNCKKYI